MAGLGFPQVSAFPLSRCASFSSWDTLVFFLPDMPIFPVDMLLPPHATFSSQPGLCFPHWVLIIPWISVCPVDALVFPHGIHLFFTWTC